jgi:hypothetical protein
VYRSASIKSQRAVTRLLRRCRSFSLDSATTAVNILALALTLVVVRGKWAAAIEDIATEEDVSDLLVTPRTVQETGASGRRWAVLPLLGYGNCTGAVLGAKFTDPRLSLQASHSAWTLCTRRTPSVGSVSTSEIRTWMASGSSLPGLSLQITPSVVRGFRNGERPFGRRLRTRRTPPP